MVGVALRGKGIRGEGAGGEGIRVKASELLKRRPTMRDHQHRPAIGKAGALASKRPGSGMDFREIRAYTEGDDIRRIDVAATARTGRLHVRSFHEDQDDTTLLICDFRHFMLWGSGTSLCSVRAARHIADQGWLATLRGGNVALLVILDHTMATLAAQTGERQMIRLAELLANEHDLALQHAGLLGASKVQGRMAQSSEKSDVKQLNEALMRASRLVPPGSDIVFVTGVGGITPPSHPSLQRLARQRRCKVQYILDPADTNPPDHSVTLHNGSRSRHGVLNPISIAHLTAGLRQIGVSAKGVFPDDTE